MNRHNLYVFRHERKLKQSEMADKIGCTRTTYSNVETGKREGRPKFWSGFQKAFNIPDNEMYKYMKKGAPKDCEQKEK